MFFTDDVDEGRIRGYNHVTLSKDVFQSVEAFDDAGVVGWFSKLLNYGFVTPDIEDSVSYSQITNITNIYNEKPSARNIGINEFDLPKVMEDCEYADKQGKDVYLLRFATTDYYFAKADEENVSGTVYASQQTCFLNLNVLSLTMAKEGVEGVVETTTIAVNSDPIDVIADPTTKEEENMFLGVADVTLVTGVFDSIGKGVSNLTKLPSLVNQILVLGAFILILFLAFKFFRWLLGKGKNKHAERKVEKKKLEEEARQDARRDAEDERKQARRARYQEEAEERRERRREERRKTKEEKHRGKTIFWTDDFEVKNEKKANRSSSESSFELLGEPKKKKKSFFKSFSDLFKSKKKK